MLLFIDEEDYKDKDFMKSLEDELFEAEKICKEYGYDADFYFDPTDYSVNGDIYKRKDEYQPTIYIRDRKKFDIEIQTTSYGALSLDDYWNYFNDCENAFNLAKKLRKTLYICSQLVKK